MSVSCIILESVARFRSVEARELRSVDQTVEWELKMMRGGYHAPGRAVVQAMCSRNNYNNFGIETRWPVMLESSANHIVVAVNDRSVEFVWDFGSNVILEFESRMIVFAEGLPRRQSMLLSEIAKERTDFIDCVKLDEEIFCQMQACNDENLKALITRSLFQKPSVKQLVGILREEAWK